MPKGNMCETKYYLSPDCAIRQEEFGGLLFQKQTGNFLSVNTTGYKIATILAGSNCGVDEIVNSLQAECGTFYRKQTLNRLRNLLIALFPMALQFQDLASRIRKWRSAQNAAHARTMKCSH